MNLFSDNKTVSSEWPYPEWCIRHSFDFISGISQQMTVSSHQSTDSPQIEHDLDTADCSLCNRIRCTVCAHL